MSVCVYKKQTIPHEQIQSSLIFCPLDDRESKFDTHESTRKEYHVVEKMEASWEWKY